MLIILVSDAFESQTLNYTGSAIGWWELYLCRYWDYCGSTSGLADAGGGGSCNAFGLAESDC